MDGTRSAFKNIHVVGQFGMGLFFGLLTIVSLGVIFIVGLLARSIVGISTLKLIIAGVVSAIVIIIVISLFSSVLNGIYLTALYTYATTRKVPKGFSPEFIKNA